MNQFFRLITTLFLIVLDLYDYEQSSVVVSSNFQPYIVRFYIANKFPHIMLNCFIQTQKSFKYCHIGPFLTKLKKNVVFPLLPRGVPLILAESSLNPLTTTWSFVGPSLTFSIAPLLPTTWSLLSTNCSLPSNNGDLEDLSTTTTVGPSFLPLGCISKLFFYAPTIFNKHNVFILLWFFLFPYTTYTLSYLLDFWKTNIWFILCQAFSSSRSKPLHMQGFQTRVCI